VHVRHSGQILFAAVFAFAANLLTAGVASAAGSYPGGSKTPPTVVQGVHFARAPLTRTGTNTYLYVIVAAVVLVAGLALRMVARARAASRV